jgi:CHAT domain-containing protein
LFQRAEQAFLHGELQDSQSGCERAYEMFRKTDPSWAKKFKVLEAKAAMWRGLYKDVLKLLQEPAPSDPPEIAVPTLTLLGIAHLNSHNFSEAERLFAVADQLCTSTSHDECGYLLQAHGLLASQQNQSATAERFYESSLAFARSRGDRFLETNALLNLGAESLTMGHFDEAIDRSEAAQQAAKAISAQGLEVITRGNIGWAYYRLGDTERALDLLLQAEKRATELNSYADRGAWLTDAGYVYMADHKDQQANEVFQKAFALEQRANSSEELYNVLRARARLALQTGDLTHADDYIEQAAALARHSRNHVDELYPLLLQGQLKAKQGDPQSALTIFQSIESDPATPIFLKWESQHSLALLYENENRAEDADQQYRLALRTFEGARDALTHESLQLSFLANGSRIYDDYVHFLVSLGRINDALRQAEFSRARTLSQGLQLLSNRTSLDAPALNAMRIARDCHGPILFYWLGERQSYVWLIINNAITLFPLPPQKEIDAAVQRYRKALIGPRAAQDYADADGRYLYSQLVAPAVGRIPKNSKVYIIPDGSLNNVNFETLIVPEPQPHFLIEDATILNANSLRLLAASCTKRREAPRSLLLIGNSTAPNERYPELPKAQVQMDKVASHFQNHRLRIFRREQATPVAYLGSSPQQFSYIHFVAHGTASRLSPLDSAIILSKSSESGDSFKLYAREIVQHRLQAQLVTISSCFGTGDRPYPGEGLVGLSWAFLRAGAHNVVAALWEVTDASTERLMDRFYQQIARGVPPESALRNAKLAILHSEFHSPFYWAPFQLYTGS